MHTLSIDIPVNQKILVVSSIFDQVHKLYSLHFDDYFLILVNGNICFPFDPLEIKKRIQTISKFPNIHYNLGGHDLIFLSQIRKEKKFPEIASWILSHPNVRILSWPSSARLMVVGGGVPKTISEIDLDGNTELSFISSQNGKPWQEFYSGHLGYAIGNNPLSDEPPEFFDYAARIGGKYRGSQTKIWAQEIGEYGLLKTFPLE